MKVFKNLFGDGSKINASEIVMGYENNYETMEIKDISHDFTTKLGVIDFNAYKIGKVVHIDFRYLPQFVGSWNEGIITIPTKHQPISNHIAVATAPYAGVDVGKPVSCYITNKDKMWFYAKESYSGSVVCSLSYISK